MDRRISLRHLLGLVTTRRTRSERGASLVEYALLIGLIAVVCVLSVALFGGAVSHQFSATGSAMH
jgi:Flp pilus assembly pilin Flp